MRREKKKQAKKADTRRPLYTGVLASLAIGAVLTCLAYWCLDALAKPELDVRIYMPSSADRLLVRLVNAGSRDLQLDLDDLDSFLVPVPNVADEYVLHIRKMAHARGSGEQRGTLLRPGDGIDIVDAAPLLAGVSGGRIVLSAVFSSDGESPRTLGLWRGFIRSLPLEVLTA